MNVNLNKINCVMNVARKVFLLIYSTVARNLKVLTLYGTLFKSVRVEQRNYLTAFSFFNSDSAAVMSTLSNSCPYVIREMVRIFISVIQGGG